MPIKQATRGGRDVTSHSHSGAERNDAERQNPMSERHGKQWVQARMQCRASRLAVWFH